jgi:hypothetical protein
MASTRGVNISEPALKRLAGLKDRREIQVYVSPT